MLFLLPHLILCAVLQIVFSLDLAFFFTASCTMALHLYLHLQWLFSKQVLFLSGTQSAVLLSHLTVLKDVTSEP